MLDNIMDVMMKKETFCLSFTRSKSRTHKVLFENDTPFKCKREEPKNSYQRKLKHGKNSWLYDLEKA